MHNHNIYWKILPILGVLGFLFSCSKEDDGEKMPDLSGELEIRTTIYNNGITSRSLGTEDPEDGMMGYLYLPPGSFGTTDQQLDSIEYRGGKWEYKRFPLHWDDVTAPETIGEKKQFYFASTDSTGFSEGTDEDLLWGEAEGWLEPLDFDLFHSMSKLTFVYVDKTLKRDIKFDNAKIVLYTKMSETGIVTSDSEGLFRKAHNFDWKTGEVTINPTITPRENKTTAALTRKGTVEEGTEGNKHTYNTGIIEIGIVPPQEFVDGTKLEITAGDYVYRIDLPEYMYKGSEQEKTKLLAGGHLTISIILTEDEIDFEATLVDWEVKETDPIDVSRVFNIGSWEEMRDLMLAINTGYTFNGMVVRLTQDIYIDKDSEVSLGTKLNPFEGIFDGNGFQIFGLGRYETINEASAEVPNVGGLFGYTRGATIQNVTLVAPHVTSTGSLGALVDVAENTTIFNCRNIPDINNNYGSVKGTGNNTGGLVGEAKGNTSLTNCYAIMPVYVTGSGENVGGLVGYTEGAVTHCSAQGVIEASNSSHVGGLIGNSANTVLNCCAWGTSITGGSNVGGLIGYTNGLISNSYAFCNIYGGSNLGSLLGAKGFNGAVQNCLWYRYSSIKIIGSGTLNETSNNSFTSEEISNESLVVHLNTGQSDIWRMRTFDGTAQKPYFDNYVDIKAHVKTTEP